MAEIYSGYGKTAYNMKNYKPSLFVPIGFRAGIGAYGLQFGPDFWTNIVSQKFSFNDSAGQEIYSEKIKDTYLGAMIRGHAGDDPKRLAVILRLGMGIYFSKRITDYSDSYVLHNPNTIFIQNYKFKNSLGYNAALGVSIPFGLTGVHLTIEGQFNYNPRKENNINNYYTTFCLQAGFSFNIIQIYDPSHYQY